jgi:RHH-type proline utilization regulon transcriptional repressor/proline dehydrogenase/delta 1-pyrroline-5-carboxylate dehydrogenase
VVVCRYALATDVEVNAAVECAKSDLDGWRSMSVDQRSAVLGRVALELRRSRADLLWAMLANSGKLLTEGDPEVSEAVDFAEFYRAAARSFFELDTVQARGGGVVVVVAVRFSAAIPCGGCAAGWQPGTVILKPASDAVLVAWEMCQCFWRAGVLRADAAIRAVPRRRAWQSARSPSRRFRGHPHWRHRYGPADAGQKPDLRLSAETGGKNATIVTALSDRELAIKRRPFGVQPQRPKVLCHVAVIADAEVYVDPAFKRMLCDAVQSLHVNSAYELHSRLGPLIRPPSGALELALKTLEPDENWAVLPRRVGENPNLWSPGVKYGVTPRSVTHCTEFFGPLLGVMRFGGSRKQSTW